ncbi:DUF222 domain-containing protein [Aquihabitans sp. McL0605]|uniref:HNH endonuclease signature motif containing protein n=1 Tax=Aquihabitans sp. McL0605 TaxID=3415671 RepID=UPI003CF5AD49
MTVTSDLRTQALHVAAVIEPELMTGPQAAAAVEDLATADKALGGALLFLALRVARTDAWRGHGHHSAADWLAAKAGISVAEASRQLGTAKKADRLPKTKDAMRKGDLSADQAGAVADGASADPSAEDDLLDSASRDTNKALKDKAAKAKAAATDSAERERRIRARRSLRRGTDADGAFWARISGPGADAATFDAMLRPFEEVMFRQGRTDGTRDTYENRSYDAYMAMLAYYGHLRAAAAEPARPEPAGEGTHDREPTDREPTDREPESDAPAGVTPPAGSPPTWSPPWDPDRVVPLPHKLPGGNNVKVIVNVDHTALLRGHTLAGETSEIAGLGPVSIAAVRAILLDDPFLAVVVRKGRDVVTVAHHGRGLNAHQRTAIEADGVRCSNRACNRSIAIEVDHRVPYGDDPITHLANQDPLCPACHLRKTHHGWHLEAGTGPRRFLPPDAGLRRNDHAPEPPLRRVDPEGRDEGEVSSPVSDDEADQIEARLRRRLAARRSGPVGRPQRC